MALDNKIEKKPLVEPKQYKLVTRDAEGGIRTTVLKPGELPKVFARSADMNQLPANTPTLFKGVENNPQLARQVASVFGGLNRPQTQVGGSSVSGGLGGTSIFASLDPNIINQQIEGVHAGFTQKTPPVLGTQGFA
jgi:hypothetical protein